MPARRSRRRKFRAPLPPIGDSLFPFDAKTWEALSTRLALPPQQLRVVELLLDDRSDIEIADALSITEATVRSHIGRIFHGLSVHTRAAVALRLMGLVRIGWHRGALIETDDVGADDAVPADVETTTFGNPRVR